MKKIAIAAVFGLLLSQLAQAQCPLEINERDAFDSTLTLLSKSVNIGYLIPSNFQTAEGNKMVEEAKIMFSFTQNDSINAFFLILAVLERDYLPIEEGRNVLIKLEEEKKETTLGEEEIKMDSTDQSDRQSILSLYNFPDRGTFDKKTNMRMYVHSCAVPLDQVFTLAYSGIEKIRIQYRNTRHTITLSKEQRESLKKAVLCIGDTAGLLKNKP
jgi:hypothetical protein